MVASVNISLSVAAGGAASNFAYGTLPTDGLGYLDGSLVYPGVPPGDVICLPAVEEGQRLSGTVTIAVNSTPLAGGSDYGPSNGTLLRLLIDGVPQAGGFQATPASWTIDTTVWPDGSHVLGVQLQNVPAPPYGGNRTGMHNGSRIVVINNSGMPFTSLEGQAIVDFVKGEEGELSLAWGRVNVLPLQTYPMKDAFSAPTVADANTLATGKVWWLDGLTNPGTNLYTNAPLLVKNRVGDYYIEQWNPQTPTNDPTASAPSLEYIQAAPAFDGDRGVAMLTPYATLVPGNVTLASGNLGWTGVDIAGRVVDVDTTGRITTWFGPRSVAGEVQTNPNLGDITLAQRVAMGEKEYVGTGPFAQMPQDIWLCTTEGDGDLWMLADTAANQVWVVSRSQQRITANAPMTAPTGVWSGLGADWAVNTTGVYKVTDQNTATLFAPVADAFAIRGDSVRGLLYVLDLSLGLWEVDPVAGTVTQRKAPRTPNPGFQFVNLTIDEFGHIGPAGNLYYAATKLGPYAFYQVPGTWVETAYAPKVLNFYNGYASEQILDTFGHYTWAIAIHPTFACFLATGISNSSWHMVSAQLGTLPPLDTAVVPATYQRGRALMEGYRDTQLGLSAIFGSTGGAGMLGYTADQWRSLQIADVQAAIAPLLPSSIAASDLTSLATYLWWQRTRPHAVL